VLRRSLARLKAAGDRKTYKSILKDYQHDGLDTCAVDGLCSLECPVTINTGNLVKRLRKENHSAVANRIARAIARNFGLVESGVRAGLRMGILVNRLFGRKAMTNLTRAIRKALPAFPLWPAQPIGPARLPSNPPQPTPPDAVYFPCCMNRLMGADPQGKGGVGEALTSVAAKAGLHLLTPDNVRAHCCGQAFASKGFPPARALAANKLVESLWRWTRQGAIPVVLDISSCTQSLREAGSALTEENRQRLGKISVLDGLDFAVDHVIPRLPVTNQKEAVILHPVCSLYKMASVEKLKRLGEFAARRVTIPASAGCCGMAGDRGFYYPGLIAAATAAESKEVKALQTGDGYSTSRPCELALTETTGKPYRSIFHLLDEVAPAPHSTVSANSQTPASAG
jgi:D-lactate dehydrogenase